MLTPKSVASDETIHSFTGYSEKKSLLISVCNDLVSRISALVAT